MAEPLTQARKVAGQKPFGAGVPRMPERLERVTGALSELRGSASSQRERARQGLSPMRKRRVNQRDERPRRRGSAAGELDKGGVDAWRGVKHRARDSPQ